MDRTQAAEIQRHLLAAADALDRASETIFGLATADRAAFADPLGAITCYLHFGLLRSIYDRYPELRPSEEHPIISSVLRWDDVTLPASVSEADLDSIIFSALSLKWQKTAMIIAKASQRIGELGLSIDAAMVGARIQALAEANRLESQGNIRKWRHSEVRLKC